MKRKKKKKLKKLPLFIIMLLLGFGGYFVLNKHVDLSSVTLKDTDLKKVFFQEKVDVINLDAKNRNVAVMINNHNSARPYHSGLNEAYLIYEVLVEGGYTRYMAIYNNKNTERIGSVRSSRHYFLDYAMENDAIYIHWGWSPQAQEDILKLGLDYINGLSYENKYFFRDQSLDVSLEHTGFTSMEKINKGIKDLDYSLVSDKKTLLKYSTEDVDLTKIDNVIIANNINIPYSGVITNSYEYDEDSKMYKRFVNGVAHVDYVTNEQYAFKNIIIYKLKSTVVDNAGRIELDNIGTGEGYYITNGYAVPIVWEKSSRASQTKYFYLNGEEMEVSDGNTFIQIQPTSKTLTIN